MIKLYEVFFFHTFFKNGEILDAARMKGTLFDLPPPVGWLRIDLLNKILVHFNMIFLLRTKSDLSCTHDSKQEITKSFCEFSSDMKLTYCILIAIKDNVVESKSHPSLKNYFPSTDSESYNFQLYLTYQIKMWRLFDLLRWYENILHIQCG